MKVDNVSFADGFVESFKSEKEFLKEMNDHGYKTELYKDVPDRDAQLKKVYALHHLKIDDPDKINSEQPEGSTEVQ